MILHSSSTPCRIAGGISLLVILAMSTSQANRHSVQSTNIVATAPPESRFFRLELTHPGKRHLEFNEDCFYNIDGVPHRALWFGYEDRRTFSVVVLRKERQIVSRSMRVEGPYRMPLLPYSSWEDDVAYVCADSGITEALAHARSRARLGNTTFVVWFTSSVELTFMLASLISKMATGSKVSVTLYVIFSGEISDSLKTACESAKNVRLICYTPRSTETLIDDYLRRNHLQPLLVGCKWGKYSTETVVCLLNLTTNFLVVIGEAFRGRGVRVADLAAADRISTTSNT